MRDIFVTRLSELAARDPRIMLVTGDLGFRVLDEFAAHHPKQFLNVGVAEQNMTGIATGLALSGRIVFTYSIANFSTLRCLEQIRNDAAYHDANVTVVAIGGGFSYGALGMSHHATEDLAIMRALPITVASPCDDWEVRHVVDALVDAPGTKYLRLDKSSAGDTSRPGEQFRFGRARQLRDGEAVTLVATGGILELALRAADRLAEEGLRCRVLSIHSVKPIDHSALVAAACETGGIVSIEEHTIHGGLGGAIAESLLDRGVAPRGFHRIGLRSGFSSIVGSQSYLRRAYGLDVDSIVAAARRVATQENPAGWASGPV